jgi:hypothetical protein
MDLSWEKLGRKTRLALVLVALICISAVADGARLEEPHTDLEPYNETPTTCVTVSASGGSNVSAQVGSWNGSMISMPISYPFGQKKSP